jgi:hypothetical protein
MILQAQCNSFMFMWPCIVSNFFLIKTNIRTNFPNLFLSRNSTCFGHSSAHHQEFFTVHSCLKPVIKPEWHITVPNVQWKTPDDGQRNCPKHVHFLDKNKFGKLVRLLFLLKRIFFNRFSVVSSWFPHSVLTYINIFFNIAPRLLAKSYRHFEGV